MTELAEKVSAGTMTRAEREEAEIHDRVGLFLERILRLRDRIHPGGTDASAEDQRAGKPVSIKDFRVHLVAHWMGGLEWRRGARGSAGASPHRTQVHREGTTVQLIQSINQIENCRPGRLRACSGAAFPVKGRARCAFFAGERASFV